MGVDFEWSSSGESAEPTRRRRHSRGNQRRQILVFAILLAVLAVAAFLFYRSLQTPQPLLRAAVREHLAAEATARADSDMEMLYTLYAGERRVNPLAPGYALPAGAEPAPQSVEEHGDDIWATVAWQADGQTLTRLQFYSWQEDRLIRVDTDPDYWPRLATRRARWGDCRSGGGVD